MFKTWRPGTAANNRGIPILLLLYALFLVLPGNAAWGETTFYEAYRNGLLSEAAGEWEKARNHFLQAVSLNPNPAGRVRTYGLNFLRDYDPYAHLARCEFELGMYEQALQHLEISLKAGVTSRENLQDLKAGLESELRKTERPPAQPTKVPEEWISPGLQEQEPAAQPATLKAVSSPSGAVVRIDGRERGLSPLEITLPAGTHLIEYSLQGYTPGRQEVDLKEGQTQTVNMILSLTPSPQPTAAAPARDESPQQKQQQTVNPLRETPIEEVRLEEEEVTPRETAPSKVEIPPTSVAIRSSSSRYTVLLLLLATALIAFFALRIRKRRLHSSRHETEARGVDAAEIPTHDLRLEPEAVEIKNRSSIDGRPEPVSNRRHDLPQNAPDRIGGYKITSVLGRGGMGTMYLASRIRDGLAVALKVPHEHVMANPEFGQRFLREGSLGATLHHPNIVRILETGKEKDVPFIAMELLRGETLETRLSNNGRLSVLETLEIARDVALALDYARLKGIVHRDLKPENIMLLKQGGLKVLDYGIARIMDSPGLTSTGMYLGTPSYSSPESTASGEVDQQSDLYSLGIILYRCLTGNLPFYSRNPLELLDMHRKDPIPPFPVQLEIPESVFGLVAKLTAKKKADRFRSAESFLIELNQVLNQLET